MPALPDLFDLYVFPLGRRQFALRQLAEAARARNWPELADECEEHVAFDAETRQLQKRRSAQIALPADPRLATLDTDGDTILGSFFRFLREAAAIGMEGAAELLSAHFPEGVGGLTLMGYVEKSEAVDALLADLRGDHARLVAACGAQPWVDRLAANHAAFSDALHARPTAHVDAGTIRARLNEGQDRMLQVVAQVLGRFPRLSAGHIDARADLLRPVMAQQERLAAIYRQRRRISDVDPATGDELTTDENPSVEPGVDPE